jgi:uncharacterized membrane protein YdfJ with MMPL/SSD domain
MKSRKSPQRRREIGLVPYLVPLGWTLAAVLAFVVLVTWPELFSQPLPPDAGSAAEAFSLMPLFGGQPSVPDASRVFTEQPSQAVEHVQAF